MKWQLLGVGLFAGIAHGLNATIPYFLKLFTEVFQHNTPEDSFDALLDPVMLFATAHWIFGALMIGWVIVYMIFLYYFTTRVKDYAQSASRSHSNVAVRFVDAISDILLVKLFAMGRRENRYLFDALQDKELIVMEDGLYAKIWVMQSGGILEDYFFEMKWCRQQDSNSRPFDHKSTALPLCYAG